MEMTDLLRKGHHHHTVQQNAGRGMDAGRDPGNEKRS